MWRIREKLEDLFYWFKEDAGNVKFILQILLSIGMVVLFLGIPLGWYDNSEKELTEGEVDTNVSLIDVDEFEILKLEELYTNSNNLSVIKADILFKNGEINSEYAQDILKYTFNQLRNKSKNEGKELIAFEINAYVSKIEYYKGVLPDGQFYKYIGDSLYSSISVNENFLSEYSKENDSEYNVLLDANIHFVSLKPRMDYIVEDGDGIEVFKIDLGPYYTEAELSTILKIDEYVTLFKTSKKSKAVEFYVYYDLGVPYDTYKHLSLTDKYNKLYDDYKALYKSRLIGVDVEVISEHYRNKYPNLWSELIIQRGY